MSFGELMSRSGEVIRAREKLGVGGKSAGFVLKSGGRRSRSEVGSRSELEVGARGRRWYLPGGWGGDSYCRVPSNVPISVTSWSRGHEPSPSSRQSWVRSERPS